MSTTAPARPPGEAAITADRPTPRPRRTLLLVPAVAALYATSACGSAFWDQEIDKGAPKDYLFTTSALPTTTTTSPTTRPATTTPSRDSAATPRSSTSSPPAATDVDHVAVCVDPNTATRVEDTHCADAEEQLDIGEPVLHLSPTHPTVVHYWYYYDTRAGLTAPPVGGKVTGGTYLTPPPVRDNRPASIARAGSVTPQGGQITTRGSTTVQRGGLGVAPGSGSTPQGSSGS